MTTSLDIYEIIGFAGMACIIAAYAYLTLVKDPKPLVLHCTNLAGAILLTISLLVHYNLPTLVLEGFWAAIAIYGIIKTLANRGEKSENS